MDGGCPPQSPAATAPPEGEPGPLRGGLSCRPTGEWSFWRGGIAVPFPTRRRWVSVLWDFVGARPHKVDSGACVLIPDGLEWGQKERDRLCFV